MLFVFGIWTGGCICVASARRAGWCGDIGLTHVVRGHAPTVGQGRGTTVGLAVRSRTRGHTLSHSIHAWRHRSTGARSAQRKETVSDEGDAVRDQTHQELE
jgi:hypothetical protein